MLLQEAGIDEDCGQETPEQKVAESASGAEEVAADTHGRSKVDCYHVWENMVEIHSGSATVLELNQTLSRPVCCLC